MPESLGQAILEVGADLTRMEAGIATIPKTLAAANTGLPPIVPRVDGTLAKAQFATLTQQLQRQKVELLLPVGIQQTRVNEIQDLTDGTKGLGLGFAELGKTALFAAGAVGVFTSATELSNFAIQQSIQLENASAAVRTLGVDSVELEGNLRDLSKELKNNVSTVDLVKAAYDVASSGFADAASATKVLAAAAPGAIGGFSDINTVADATTSVLNAYSLSADSATKVVDSFIQTQNDGKVVVAEIAQQIGRVAPIAASAGVSFQELGAAISVSTAKGLPAFSAYAGLRQAITAILKPTSEATELASSLGLEFNAQSLKAKGLGGFLEQVAQKTGGAVDANVKLFGSVEAVAAIQPLLNDQLKTYNDFLGRQAGLSGQATKAAEEVTNTLSGSLARLKNAISDVATQSTTLAGAPLTKLVQGLTALVELGPKLGSGLVNAFAPAVEPLTLLVDQIERLSGINIGESLGKLGNDLRFEFNQLGGGQNQAGAVLAPGTKEAAEFEKQLADLRAKTEEEVAKRAQLAAIAQKNAQRDILKPAQERLDVAQRLFGLEGRQLLQAKTALDLQKAKLELDKAGARFQSLGGNAAVAAGDEAAINAKASFEAAGIDLRAKIVEGADALQRAAKEAQKNLEQAQEGFDRATRNLQQARDSVQRAEESRALATANSGLGSASAIAEDRQVLLADIANNRASGRIDERKLAGQFGLGFNPNAGGFATGIDRLPIDQLAKIAQATSPLVDSQKAVVEAQKGVVDSQKALKDSVDALKEAQVQANDRESNLTVTVPIGGRESIYLP